MSGAPSGVEFTNEVDEMKCFARMLIADGSGVALGDVDGDGLCDLFFASLSHPCALYRNLGGWKFRDVTEEAGLTEITSDEWYAKGACFADFNGDGHLDLLVSLFGDRTAATGGVRAWRGDGAGHFTEVTESCGLASNRASHTFALGDVDGDGDLDLYVANYRNETIRDSNIAMTGTRGRERVMIRDSYDHRDRLIERLIFPMAFGSVTVPPAMRERFWVDGTDVIHENGLADQLWLNDGAGKFMPVSWTDGSFRDEDGAPLKGPPLDFGLTATIRDFNDDGAPDIYVCNDFETPDRLWLGDGRGGFRASPRLSWRQMPITSMGVDVADIDRDGHTDFFVVDMLGRTRAHRVRQRPETSVPLQDMRSIESRPQVLRNMLYRNRGDGTWSEIAHLAGVEASDWSWQPIFLDVDLDGYEDLFITNGFHRDRMDADTQEAVLALGVLTPRKRRESAAMYAPLAPPKVAFRNRGDLTFEDAGKRWGLDLPGIAHGVAEADLDNDGDLDLVVNMFQEPALLLRNNCPAPRVAVRLHGQGANRRGIGAKVTLRGGAVPVQAREMFAGGRYLSGGEAQLCFAAGKAGEGMSLEVVWRSGARSVVDGVKANRIYEIDEP